MISQSSDTSLVFAHTFPMHVYSLLLRCGPDFFLWFFCIQIVRLDTVLFNDMICFSGHQILQWISVGLQIFLHANRLNIVLFNVFFVHHILQNLNGLVIFLHTNRLAIVLFNDIICFCVHQILQNLNGFMNFLHTNRLDIVFFNDTICFLCASNFAMNLNGLVNFLQIG